MLKRILREKGGKTAEDPQAAAERQIIRDYWRQCRKHPWWSLASFLLPSAGTLFVSYVPPLVVASLVDLFATRGEISLAGTQWYLLAFGGSWLFGEVLWRVGFHYLVKLEAAGMAALDRKAFALLLDQGQGFHASQAVGSIAKRAHAYAKNFERFTDTLVFEVVSNVMSLAFVGVVLWGYSPWLPGLLMVSLALGVALAVPVIRKRKELVARRHRASSRLMGHLSDSMLNALSVQAFAREGYEKEHYAEQVREFEQRFKDAANFQNLRYDTRMAPIYVATNVLGLAAAIYFAAAGGMQAGAVVLVFSYYSQVSRVLWKINSIYRGLESSVTESAEFLRMLVPSPEPASPPEDLADIRGHVVFEGVSFSYPEGPKTVLRDFSLDIQPGERVGLVGSSGGGKSTVTKLLLRFLEPQSGRILIDGQDIAKVSLESLRSQMAYVPQDTQLFNRTLRDNISYSKPEAANAEVEEAAILAKAAGFIGRLPDGYGTLVGERGVRLSGGQRQRIAIARALLRDAPILVLDEATSALDSVSERFIQEGLLRLMEGRTAIVIAHRLATLRHLDRIVVMEGGHIVQSGTHEELLCDLDGPYRRLWLLQADGGEGTDEVDGG